MASPASGESATAAEAPPTAISDAASIAGSDGSGAAYREAHRHAAPSSATSMTESATEQGSSGESDGEEEVPEVTIKQCREAFHMFDRGAGWMLSKDLGPALRVLGQIPSDNEVDMIAAKLEQEELYDKGHTKLSFQQFHQVVMENFERKTDIREMVLDSFKTLDPEGTGFVEAAKLTSLLTCMGEALTAGEMKELLQEAGVNKEGKVNYIKFVEAALNFEAVTTEASNADKEAPAAAAPAAAAKR